VSIQSVTDSVTSKGCTAYLPFPVRYGNLARIAILAALARYRILTAAVSSPG
jgi:hypothetical protein